VKFAALAIAAVLLAAGAVAAGFPPSVEALLPQLTQAETRLQGATLAHEAARREAAPEQEAVAQARAQSEHWWGRWRLRRALGRLKTRLDEVERSRVEREAARQELFLLLTGLEEELRGALEKAAVGPKPKAPLAQWWRQEQAWSSRLETLELAKEEGVLEASPKNRLLAQARLQQLQRDSALLKVLERRRILDLGEVMSEEKRLASAQKLWKHLVEAGQP
jgi:hypothetical protein